MCKIYYQLLRTKYTHVIELGFMASCKNQKIWWEKVINEYLG